VEGTPVPENPEEENVSDMSSFEKTLCRLLQQRESFVMATVVDREGSAPRTAGTRMIVREDGSPAGTIGGGLVEARVIDMARKLYEGAGALLQHFEMTSEVADTMDMICGGRMDVLIERVEPGSGSAEALQRFFCETRRSRELLVTGLGSEDSGSFEPARAVMAEDGSLTGDLFFPEAVRESLRERARQLRRPSVMSFDGLRYLVEPSVAPGTVYLFGAGHVAREVAALASRVDFRVIVADDREEFASRERFPDALEVRVPGSFETAVGSVEFDENCYVVILTRGHAHDKTVLADALRTEAGYVGMIGSRRKRDAIYRALEREGFTKADLERVHCPVGLSIGAETVPEIAVSIVAELIQVRAERNLS
jgi:xanthine dehydrogenase accessory factor